MTANRPQNRMGDARSDAPPRPSNKPTAKTVAHQFTHQYYTVFSKYPRYLYRFYDRASSLTVCEMLENGTTKTESADNQEGIHDLVMQLFGDSEVMVESVSPQFSQNGGILLQVTGTLSRQNKPDSAFSQSFFLAVQETGFFVLNDILHLTPKSPQKPTKEMAVQAVMPAHAPPPSPQYSQTQAFHHEPTPDAPHSPEESAATHFESPYHGSRSRSVEPEGKRSFVDILTPPGHPGGTPREAHPVRIPEVRVPPPSMVGGPPFSPPLHPPSVKVNGVRTGGTSAFLGVSDRLGSGPGFQRNSSVFVRDVPSNVDEAVLRGVFEKYGSVTGVVIRNGRRDSRFAFVDFGNTEAMDRALQANITVNGRRLFVEEKKPLVLRNKQRPRRAGSGSPGPQDTGNGAGGAIHFF